MQYQIATAQSQELPWVRALEGACLAKMGRTAEALAILDEARSAFATPSTWTRIHMAILRQALGQTDEAFDELERAGEENSAWLYSLNVDPKMDVFRGDPRYERLRDKLFGACLTR